MRIRSLAPLAVAVALGGALFATPVKAANVVTVKPETFAGGAAARALDISILGNKLTLGDTVANIVKGVSDTGATTLLAKAVGTGQLSLIGNTVASSSLTAAGTNTVSPQCAGIALPELITAILSVGIACGGSAASIDSNGLMNTVVHWSGRRHRLVPEHAALDARSRRHRRHGGRCTAGWRSRLHAAWCDVGAQRAGARHQRRLAPQHGARQRPQHEDARNHSLATPLRR